MKRKKLISTLTAMTLVAVMGLSAVPATAINVFAEVEATTDTEQAAVDATKIDGALASAVKGTDTKASDLASEVEAAMDGYTATVKIDSTKTVAPTLTNEGTIKAGSISGSVSISNGTITEEFTFTVDTDPSVLTNKEKITIAKTVVANGFAKEKFAATGTINDATVMAKAKAFIAESPVSDVTVEDASVEATESTKTTPGTVTGTVSLKVAEVKTKDVVVYAEETDDATINSSRALIASNMDAAVSAVTSATNSGVTIPQDFALNDIATFVNATILADDAYDGVTATGVQMLGNKTEPEHNDGEAPTNGSLLAAITLAEAGTENTRIITFTATVVESDETKLAEVSAEVDTALAKIVGTDIQKKNSTSATTDIAVEQKYTTEATKAITKHSDVTVKDVEVTKFEAATVSKEGTATIKVTLEVPNDDYVYALSDDSGVTESAEETIEKELTYTITFDTLKAKALTSVELGSEIKRTVTPNSNAYRTIDLGSKLAKVPADGNDELEWTSSDEDVAVVDEDGVVTIKGEGTVVITVTSKSNSKVTDSVRITVSADDDNWYFTDVQDASKYYFYPVYAAANNGIVAGLTETTFGPDESVTRAQMVTFLYRLAGEPNVKVNNNFTDVSADSPFAKAISWAAAEGITSGTTATTFSPDATCTRGQIVAFLYRFYDADNSSFDYGAVNYTDVPATSPFADAIAWATYVEVTLGYADGSFGIDDPCTRAQAVTFLGRSSAIDLEDLTDNP